MIFDISGTKPTVGNIERCWYFRVVRKERLDCINHCGPVSKAYGREENTLQLLQY